MLFLVAVILIITIFAMGFVAMELCVGREVQGIFGGFFTWEWKGGIGLLRIPTPTPLTNLILLFCLVMGVFLLYHYVQLQEQHR